MALLPTVCKAGARFGLSCLGRFLLWTVWLLLTTLLGIGLWVATADQIHLPRPIVAALEQRLAELGLPARIQKVTLSDGNRLEIAKISLRIPGFEDPVFSADRIFTRFDLWALLAERPEAHMIEIEGASISIPAPLSPSGTAVPILSELDASLSYGAHQLHIEHLRSLATGLTLRVSGAVDLSEYKRRDIQTKPRSLGALLIPLLRQAARHYPSLRQLRQGWVEIKLQASPEHLALARVHGGLPEIEWDTLPLPPLPEKLGKLSLGASEFSIENIPLKPGPLTLQVHLRTQEIASDLGQLKKPSLSFRLDTSSVVSNAWKLSDVHLSVPSVDNRWAAAEGLVLECSEMKPGQTELALHLAAMLTGNFIAADATLTVPDGSGSIALNTELSTRTIEAIGHALGRDITRFCSLFGRGRFTGTVTLDPHAKLRLAEGWIHADGLNIYRFLAGNTSGRIRSDGHSLFADHASLVAGEDHATGSYEMDFHSLDFRFLLRGQLRPAHIGPWFRGWWTPFWKSFDFERRAPSADIDIQGRWRHGRSIDIYLGADAEQLGIRGVALDRARTRIHIRPWSIKAIDIEAWRPEGFTRGWFERQYSAQKGNWTLLRFGGEGAMDPVACAPLISQEMANLAANFVFKQAPSAQVKGWIAGPAADSPGHSLDFRVASVGPFHLFDFPLEDLQAEGTWEGPDLRLKTFQAKAARGILKGTLRVDTEGDGKGLDITANLNQASLPNTIDDVEEYLAHQEGRSYTRDPKRLPSLTLDLSLTASGKYNDPLSFVGTGEAMVRGEELTQVRLLGGLSNLLSFTSLRFTNAKANFQVDHKMVHFGSIRIMGRNSAIDGGGSFQLDNRAMDFKAKVWPFDETSGLLQGALGLVLAPLSHAFEVRLGGTLTNPEWAFVNNPFRIQTPAAAPSEPAQ